MSQQHDELPSPEIEMQLGEFCVRVRRLQDACASVLDQSADVLNLAHELIASSGRLVTRSQRLRGKYLRGRDEQSGPPGLRSMQSDG